MNSIRRLYLVVALMVMSGVCTFAQTSGMKIVSVHPDIKFKITRCEAAGKIVVIDFVIENVGSSDINLQILSSISYDTASVAYDDEGNIYGSGSIGIKLGNSKMEGEGALETGPQQVLPSEIPVKGRIQIGKVPESATMFKRLDLKMSSRELNFNNRSLRITNIPISREGDE